MTKVKNGCCRNKLYRVLVSLDLHLRPLLQIFRFGNSLNVTPRPAPLHLLLRLHSDQSNQLMVVTTRSICVTAISVFVLSWQSCTAVRLPAIIIGHHCVILGCVSPKLYFNLLPQGSCVFFQDPLRPPSPQPGGLENNTSCYADICCI